MKDLQMIQNEVAKERVVTGTWNRLSTGLQNILWPEVCRRYAIEVARASLEKAASNVLYDSNDGSVDYDSITSEYNIVLL